MVFEVIHQILLELSAVMQILAYSCQSVELLLQFDPDVVGDEGNIARQSLVDGLLYSNARLDNIEQSFAFGNVD